MSDPALPPYDSELALANLRWRAPHKADDVLSRRRDVDTVRMRRLWWNWLHEEYEWSYRRIARATGYDRTAVSRGIRRIER